ncbi:19774_t:CDS:2, partial [Gigaspora margarita]
MKYAANNEYTECATNNKYTERATNNEYTERNDNEISNDLVSETGSSIQTESSSNTFNNPYFEDYTKALNPSYNPPKRTALATSILDAEAANIIIKVDKELSKAKNLTLCINSWCSPL